MLRLIKSTRYETTKPGRNTWALFVELRSYKKYDCTAKIALNDII